MIEGVNLSLKRIKTDHLDLIQFHGAPSKELLHEAIQALQDLKREGKVRFIGCSTVLPDVTELLQLGVFDTFQMPYSSVEREHEAVITQIAKAGAGTIIRGGVGRGEPGYGLADPDRWKMWEAARLDELLGGMDKFEFMLRFTITHPDVSTTIVGTLNPEHVTHNMAAFKKGPLPAATYAEAKKRLTVAGAVPV